MTLPFNMEPPLLTNPEIGYRLIRRRIPPRHFYHPNATIHLSFDETYADFGVFSTLVAAESAAHREMEILLRKHSVFRRSDPEPDRAESPQHGGIKPTTFTFDVPNAKDFEIRKVEIYPATSEWMPEPGCEDELFRRDYTETDWSGATRQVYEKPVVNVPRLEGTHRRASISTCSREHRNHDNAKEVLKCESDPLWSASKVPLWKRRPEGPFRGPDDKPYDEHISFVRDLRRLESPGFAEAPVLRMVLEQRDELAEVPELGDEPKSEKEPGLQEEPEPQEKPELQNEPELGQEPELPYDGLATDGALPPRGNGIGGYERATEIFSVTPSAEGGQVKDPVNAEARFMAWKLECARLRKQREWEAEEKEEAERKKRLREKIEEMQRYPLEATYFL